MTIEQKNRAMLGFDMFRLTKSKQSVDLSPNTIRQYVKRGLPVYGKGRAIFISRSDLIEFIRDPKSFEGGH